MHFHFFRWACFFLLLFFAANCTWRQGLKEPQGEGEFIQEISRLEGIARYHPEASVRAQAHLRLAFLFVNHRNPKLDYTRALQEMNAYLSLVPAGVQNDDFQNWFAVLEEVKHLRWDGVKARVKNQELQTGIDQLRANLEKALEANKMLHNETGNLREINSRMKEAIENLREMNNRMKETIETLKNLDSQMEERRRLIK